MEKFRTQESAEEMKQCPTTSSQKSLDTSTKSAPINARNAYLACLGRLEKPTGAPSTLAPGRPITFVERLRDRARQLEDEYTDLRHRIETFRAESSSDEDRARKSAEATLKEDECTLRQLRRLFNQESADKRTKFLDRGEIVIRETIDGFKAEEKSIIYLYNSSVKHSQGLLYTLEADLDLWKEQPFMQAMGTLETGLRSLRESRRDPAAINGIAEEGWKILSTLSVVHTPLVLKVFREIAKIKPEPGRRLYCGREEKDDTVEERYRSHFYLLAEVTEEEQEAREDVQRARDRLALAVKQRMEVEQAGTIFDVKKPETI